MRDRTEFVQLLDRYRFGQTQRLSIGLHVAPDFRQVHGALILVEGRGKYLRTQWIEQRQFEVPESIAKSCRELRKEHKFDAGEFFQLRQDLTRTLSSTVAQLASLSGKAAKKLMVICVSDPGVWPVDFDGRRTFESYCEATLLAELTGITVVDSLPQRDLAGGGRGAPLAPLANWLLLADRNPKVATDVRMLLDLKHDFEVSLLPESDGLDNELPKIKYAIYPGLRFEDRLLEKCGQKNLSYAQRSQVGAQGKVISELAENWQKIDLDGETTNEISDATVERLVDRSVDIIARCGISSESVIRTVNWFWAQRAGELFGHASNKVRKLEIIGGGLAPINGLLINELRVCFDSIEFRRFDEIGLNPQYIDSVATAVLGLMHIDQMPANIPWLTGCQFPRVLGRLTPGRPSNWRQVIMEMADYRPPVMKLREAV